MCGLLPSPNVCYFALKGGRGQTREKSERLSKKSGLGISQTEKSIVLFTMRLFMAFSKTWVGKVMCLVLDRLWTNTFRTMRY